MSIYSDHFNAVADMQDQIWGSEATLYPMLDGVPDSARLKTDLRVVVRVADVKTSSVSGGRGTSWKSRYRASKTQAFISVSSYVGPEIKSGDRLRVTDQSGQPWFDVVHVNYNDPVRIILDLVEA